MTTRTHTPADTPAVPDPAGADLVRDLSGSWSDLVSTAVVGVERRAFAPDAALPAGLDAAQALLRQAMLSAIPVLTGTPPARYEGALPDPAPESSRPLVPESARLRLRAVLDVYPKYLGEWLEAVSASGFRLPLDSMPALLDAGRSQEPVRAVLARVLGEPGHWLARQNPEWRYLLRECCGPLRPEDWNGPDPDARVAYLNGLYAADPAAARDLVTQAWPGLSTEMKSGLILPISRHATERDLPFLEVLKKDAPKKLRERVDRREAQLRHQGGKQHRPHLTPEQFTAEVARCDAAEVYRFASEHTDQPWPLEGARAMIHVLRRFSRDKPAEPEMQTRRTWEYWSGDRLLSLLADHAPVRLRAEVEQAVQDQAADIAAGIPHRLDFTDLLAPLGFRAEMHAELTASADAVPGQE